MESGEFKDSPGKSHSKAAALPKGGLEQEPSEYNDFKVATDALSSRCAHGMQVCKLLRAETLLTGQVA